VTWCRDGQHSGSFGVYRADGARDAYLIAIGDAGRAVRVGRSGGALVLSEINKDRSGPKAWSVSLIELGRTLTSADYNRLPPPAQAIAIAQNGRFVSSTPSWGTGNRTITINPGR
jgi:hypothetical protein